MAEDTQTVQTETDTTIQTVETKPEKPVEPFKSFATKDDFDNEIAKIRGNAERKTRSELFKTLGIDSEDKIEVVKKAYEDSLTEQERLTEQLKERDTLKAQLAESNAIITALSKTSNRPAEEIKKLVKMAKGLVSDDCTIEQALDEVIALVNKQAEKPQIPTSQAVVKQPETKIPKIEENPFKTNNLTEITKLKLENPEKARQMAKAANYKISW